MIHIFKHLVAPIFGNSIRQSIATGVQNGTLSSYSVDKCLDFFGDPTSVKEAGKILTTWEKWPPGTILQTQTSPKQQIQESLFDNSYTMLRCPDVPLHLECQ